MSLDVSLMERSGEAPFYGLVPNIGDLNLFGNKALILYFYSIDHFKRPGEEFTRKDMLQHIVYEVFNSGIKEKDRESEGYNKVDVNEVFDSIIINTGKLLNMENLALSKKLPQEDIRSLAETSVDIVNLVDSNFRRLVGENKITKVKEDIYRLEPIFFMLGSLLNN